MSSVGQAVGMVGGGVIGSFFGMTALGASIGGAIGGYLDPPKTKRRTPSVDELRQQVSAYGSPIPRVYGTISVYGCVFWIKDNQLEFVAGRKKKGGKGGGSQSVESDSYFGTFALGLCEGPITGIKRIWFGPKLVYDATATDAAGINTSYEFAQYFTLYTGAMGQPIDPTIQAELGIGLTPAWRGLAYLVFRRVPLADYGNTIAGLQIKVEVTALPITPTYAVTFKQSIEIGGTSGLTNIGTTDDPLTFYMQRWDSTSPFRRLMYGGTQQETLKEGYEPATVIDAGHYDSFSGLPYHYQDESMVFPGGEVISGFTPAYDAIAVIAGVSRPGGVAFLCKTTPSAGVAFYKVDGGKIVSSMNGDLSEYYYNWPFGTSLFSLATTSSTTWSLKTYDDDFVLSGTYIFSGAFVPLSTWDIHRAQIDGNKLYVGAIRDIAGLYQLHKLTLDLVSLTVTEEPFPLPPGYTNLTDYIGGAGGMAIQAMKRYPNGSFSFWFNCKAAPARIVHVIWGPTTDFSAGIPLSEIVAAESLRSNILTLGDIDVTALTQTVRGYKVSASGAIRSAIEPLQSAFPFDAVPSGYQVRFTPRGGASVMTVAEGDLDAREYGQEAGVKLTETTEMDTQLPRRVVVNYLDADREYDPGQQDSRRYGTDAVNEVVLDLAIVLTAGEAALIATKLRDLYWTERVDYSFTLPPGGEYSKIEAGDILTITLSDATHEVRVSEINYLPDWRLECKARRYLPSVNYPPGFGESGVSTGKTLSAAPPTVALVLDIPQVHSGQSDPCVLLALRPLYPGKWRGASLLISSDGGLVWDTVSSYSGAESTVGYTSAALAAPVEYGLQDYAQVPVTIYSGAPTSVEFTDWMNGKNVFAIGAHGRWEIVSVRTVTQVSANDFIFSGMIRGLYGTESSATLHQSGDQVVWLNENSLALLPMDASALDGNFMVKAVSFGSPVESALSVPFRFDGVAMETLSPILLNGYRDPSTGNYYINAVRRTRFNGGLENYVDVPINEVTSTFELDVFIDGGFTMYRRTLISSTPDFVYLSADQVTDFGYNPYTIYVKIYQISSRRGRGMPLAGELTRY